MGGFALALGGAGNAAQQYGQQMRQLLEQRKSAIADMLSRQAEAEPNQQKSMALRKTATDVVTKDTGTWLQSVANLAKKHADDTQKLNDGIQTISSLPGAQPPPQAPPPTPGVTPVGGVGGTGLNALSGAAAQPSTSPAAKPDNGGQIITPSPLLGAPAQSPPNIEPTADVNQFPPAPDLAGPSTSPVAIPGALSPINGAPSAQTTGGVPDIYSVRNQRQAIIDKYTQKLANTSFRFQPAVEAQMKGELDALAPFEQIAEKQMQFEQFKQTPEYARLSDMGKGYAAMQAYGLQPYAPPSSIFRPEAKVVDAERMTPEDKLANGIPSDATGPYTTYTDIGSGRPAWKAQPGRVTYEEVAGPNGIENRPRLPGPVTASDNSPALPLSSLGVINTGLVNTPEGVKTAYQQRRSLLLPAPLPKGDGNAVPSPYVTGVGTPSSMLATSHSSEPTATGGTASSTAKQLPGVRGNGKSSSPQSNNTPPAANPNIAPIDNAKDPATNLVKMTAGDILQGTESFDKLKPGMQNEVKQYMIRNHVLMPISVTAAGEKTLSTVTPVIQQIDDLVSQLADAKKNNANLILAYKEYSNGRHTPYDSLFTGVAFERLRSAAQALSGVGSRSYQVLDQGLQHTPNFDRLHGFNPDDIQEMTDKLQTAKKILMQERDNVWEYQRKSGVAPPQNGGGLSEKGPSIPPVYSPDNPFAPKR